VDRRRATRRSAVNQGRPLARNEAWRAPLSPPMRRWDRQSAVPARSRAEEERTLVSEVHAPRPARSSAYPYVRTRGEAYADEGTLILTPSLRSPPSDSLPAGAPSWSGTHDTTGSTLRPVVTSAAPSV